ncbi:MULTISPECIES: hypothetical protein [unclassified Bradyrhizobium]|uniref:hypothetical protein n=1 Tax=unclassified Bradyrhizobium TaxID=2631580 RepID=UPI00339693B8
MTSYPNCLCRKRRRQTIFSTSEDFLPVAVAHQESDTAEEQHQAEAEYRNGEDPVGDPEEAGLRSDIVAVDDGESVGSQSPKLAPQCVVAVEQAVQVKMSALPEFEDSADVVADGNLLDQRSPPRNVGYRDVGVDHDIIVENVLTQRRHRTFNLEQIHADPPAEPPELSGLRVNI